MAKKIELDKMGLLGELPEIKYVAKNEADEQMMQQMSLGPSLLKLANIDHDREYELCLAVAQQLLHKVPQPDDVDLDQE